jgi:cation diffusion facilitator CzcD-associated flavoprotein CzcO
MGTQVAERRYAREKGGVPPTAMESVAVAIVGGGQAGLATSRELTKAGLPHVVLERGRMGDTWRNRWDSFRLVSPNWAIQLPDGHYTGPEPDGFMPRDEFVAYLERYAAESAAPIREHVSTNAVQSLPGDGFVLHTSVGDIYADAVVLATGAYQRPHRPLRARTLPPELVQIDVDDYRNEQALPPGKVLIIGSGLSGCQIAQELSEAGRNVVLALRQGALGPETLRRPRLLVVGSGNRLPRGAAGVASRSRGTAFRRPCPRPRARTQPAYAPSPWRDADRTLPRRHAWQSALCPRP